MYSEKNKLQVQSIIDTSKWRLNESQREFIKSIRASDICSEVGEALSENMKDILSNNISKMYKFLIFNDLYSSNVKLELSLVKWIKFMWEYSRISLSTVSKIKYGTEEVRSLEGISDSSMVLGAKLAMIETIRNSDIYCNPRIISNDNLSTSPSIFLNSKPNVIVSIGE